MTPRFTLYHLSWCPYCQRVIAAAERLEIALALVDLDNDPEARAMLLRSRGTAMVPVLAMHADAETELLGESRDIIAFLESVARSPGA